MTQSLVHPPHWMDVPHVELTTTLAKLGQPQWRLQQLIEAYCQHYTTDLSLSTWPQQLKEHFFLSYRWAWFSQVKHLVDPDGTQKWVFTLTDGKQIQTVMIPDRDRRTLCVSTQVGCAMQCAFCSTGDQGFTRHLTVGEIVGQWLLINQQLIAQQQPKLSNLVFMGMGEPLHNEKALRAAIDWLTSPQAIHLSTSRITVSTVGLLAPLQRLITETKVNIALSLHAADKTLRKQIVPAEQGMPSASLRQLLLEHRQHFRGRKLTIEVTLLRGVNDSAEAAHALVKWLKTIPAHVNLIPFNSYPGGRFVEPHEQNLMAFQKILQRADIATYIRRPRGRTILAACGTLNTQKVSHLDA